MDAPTSSDFVQTQLFVEEICCELARFHHVSEHGLEPEDVRVTRELALGGGDRYADIHVAPGGRPSYFIEVSLGMGARRLVRDLALKYAERERLPTDAEKLYVLTSLEPPTGETLEQIRGELAPGLDVEIWDERLLCERIHGCFGVGIEGFGLSDLIDVRRAIDRAKWRHAFKGEHADDILRPSLLWHFGFWRLAQLNESRKREPREVLAPGRYENVVVLMADLCSFSSFVRDTPDSRISRNALTEFYSKSRHQILNAGGMLYQFVGDEAIAFFGLPEPVDGALDHAMACARSLVDVGDSVSHHWQRSIDRIQPKRGIHLGMAVGDLEVVAERPFSRTHFGAVSDAVNLAARLLGESGQRELTVSNLAYQGLAEDSRDGFQELEPIEARNVGRIKAWRRTFP